MVRQVNSGHDSEGSADQTTDESDSKGEKRDIRYNWSRMSLDDMVAVYWSDIAPKRRREGFDEDRDVPTYEWLTDHGYSGIAYALREHHDLTPRQFFVDAVGLSGNDPDEWSWDIDHQPTVDALEAHLRTLGTLGQRTNSTVETHRTRLAKWVRTYRDLHGTDALLIPLDDMANQPQEMNRCYAVLEVFGEQLSTDRSKLEYLHVVRRWYEYLVGHGYAQFDPLSQASKDVGWEADDPDPSALSAAQIRRIYTEVSSPDEELLVVALAGWGLRPSEVAALHTQQIVLDADDPHLSFDEGERKNGPGEVTLLYGVDLVADRLDALADRREWDGHLFPSRSSSTGHVATNTIRRRFKRVADRAGVIVDGETPTPKMGRRFWYSAYQEAVSEVVEGLKGVAADQGSSSVDVVMRNYISEEQLRQARREKMRERLHSAFDNMTSYSP
jgi:integrase